MFHGLKSRTQPLFSSAQHVTLTFSSLRKFRLLEISSPPHCAPQMPLSPRVTCPIPAVPNHEELPPWTYSIPALLAGLAHPSTIPRLFLSLKIAPWPLFLTYFSLLLKLSKREQHNRSVPPLLVHHSSNHGIRVLCPSFHQDHNNKYRQGLSGWHLSSLTSPSTSAANVPAVRQCSEKAPHTASCSHSTQLPGRVTRPYIFNRFLLMHFQTIF